MFNYFISKLKLRKLSSGRFGVGYDLSFVCVERKVLVLREQSACYFLHVAGFGVVRLCNVLNFEKAEVFLSHKDFLSSLTEGRRDNDFKENLDHFVSRILVNLSVAGYDTAENGYGIAGVRLFVCVANVLAKRNSAGVCVLNRYDSGLVRELFEKIESTATVVNIIIRKLFAVKLNGG